MHTFLVGAVAAGVIFLIGLLFKIIGKRVKELTPEEVERMNARKGHG